MDLLEKYQLPKPQPFSENLDIIIADGQTDLRLIMDHHLKKLGFHNIRLQRDGRALLQEIRNKIPDLIFVGDNLPSVTGMDLLREIREDLTLSGCVCVLMTKALQKQEVMLAVESGIDEMLIRPFAASDIVPKMRAAYGSYHSQKNPERLHEFAKQKIKEKNLEVAQAVFTDLSTQAEKSARPFLGLAKLYLMQNDEQNAMEYANHAIAANPFYVFAYSLRAELFVKQKNIENASKDFKKAAELSPLNLLRYEKAVEVLLSNGYADECQELLEMAVQAGLRHHFVVERLGHCYFVKKNYPHALKYMKEAVRLEPENTSYLNSLAICYRDALQYDNAIDIYNQILKRENDNHLVLFNKSLVLGYMKRYDEGIKLLRRVLKLRPDFEKAKDKITDFESLLDD